MRQLLGIAILLASVGCRPGGETERQEVYPSRPIKVVVPFAPGGGTDTFARIFKRGLEDGRLLPERLTIINVDGAGGTIGSRRVKTARADGYTVLLLHDAILTARVFGTVPYGPEAFEPVAGTGEVGLVVVTWGDRFRDLRHLMDTARERPDTVIYGANLGASSHFVGLELERAVPGAAFRFTQIGGGARRFAALRGGHIELTVFAVEEYLHFQSGGLRALAFLGDGRHAVLPDLPTASEQGVDVIASNMYFWWVPHGTPPERIDVLARALEAAGETESVREWMARQHCEPVFLRGAPLRARLAALEREAESVGAGEPADLPDLPALVLGGIAGLSVLVLLRSRRRSPGAPGGETTLLSGDTVTKPRLDLAAACVLLTALYVLVMNLGWLGFRAATVPYILVTGGVLGSRRPGSLAALAGLALLLGLGVHYLFSRWLVIDLP